MPDALEVEEDSQPLNENMAVAPIDSENARFPYCVVWAPLPIVAWLVPFVGHVGICHASGIILDFAGPYFVNVDNFAFGSTVRYVRLRPDMCCFPASPSDHRCGGEYAHSKLEPAGSWDEALRATMRHYQHRSYNILTSNCHSFVVSCLNRMAYDGRTNWNLVDLVLLLLTKGKWVNTTAVFKTFGPFLIVTSLGLFIGGMSFLYGWLAFSLLLLGWFLFGTYVSPAMIQTK